MSNHIHGIFAILDKEHTIGHIISQFKASVTKEIRKISSDKKVQIWQDNYYEHIIRPKETEKIQWYIRNNPYNIYKDRYD
jgi:REP element-mobilizing transposase RayT